ncbi:MAG: hypothetical protein ACREE5_01565, partial [Acetobacteraceae bacterium]
RARSVSGMSSVVRNSGEVQDGAGASASFTTMGADQGTAVHFGRIEQKHGVPTEHAAASTMDVEGRATVRQQ